MKMSWKFSSFQNELTAILLLFMKGFMIETKNKDSIKLFHDDIQLSLKNIQFTNDLTIYPNLTYDMLEQVISSAKEKLLKPNEVKFNHYKHEKNPWITKGI